jgi:TolB protein
MKVSKKIGLRAASGIAVLLFALTASITGLAQEAGSHENYAIFVSQRNGAAELYLLDLNTRQVSQLTNTGRGHLTPAISGSREIVFASREGSNYELFSASLGTALRTRRPTITSVNRLTTNFSDETGASVTHDGRSIAFVSGNGIEIMAAVGAGRQIVVPASEQSIDFAPAISPDGTRIVFVSDRGGEYDLWTYARANGELRQLTRGAKASGGLRWSADGKQVVFNTTATNSESSGIALADADSGAFRVLTDKGDFNGTLSARGDRMLFTSTRDGDAELYLLTLSTGTTERLTFSAGVDDGAIFVAEPVRQSRPAAR